MKKLHKNKRKERNIDSIKTGSWESGHIACPPASTEQPQSIFARFRNEESAEYWRIKHGVKP